MYRMPFSCFVAWFSWVYDNIYAIRNGERGKMAFDQVVSFILFYLLLLFLLNYGPACFMRLRNDIWMYVNVELVNLANETPPNNHNNPIIKRNK